MSNKKTPQPSPPPTRKDIIREGWRPKTPEQRPQGPVPPPPPKPKEK